MPRQGNPEQAVRQARKTGEGGEIAESSGFAEFQWGRNGAPSIRVFGLSCDNFNGSSIFAWRLDGFLAQFRRSQKSAMKITSSLLFSVTLLALGASNAGAAVTITAVNTSVPVAFADFSATGTNRGAIALPVSASAAAGYYSYSAGNAIAVVASGSGVPTFSLTFTNGTVGTLTEFTLSGTVYQFKDNSSNVGEVLAASVAGSVTVPAPAALNITMVSNDGNTASTPNNPPLTKPYSVTVSGVSWVSGSSFTLTWSDTNDGGTDAMFGIGGVSITAVPETSAALLGALGVLGMLRRRR